MKKILIVSGYLSFIAGLALLTAGIWGLSFTYDKVSRENITTPSDASIPDTPVRGPLTLLAQAEAMRGHMLRMSEGKAYAELPQKIALLDESGAPVLDESGELVMTTNGVRDTWVTATTFITALNLGILTYAFFSLLAFLGLVFIWHSILFFTLSKKH